MPTTRVISAVGAFVFDKQGRVFLAKFTNKFDQQWSIPGGKIEFGESPEAAIKRELKEETQLELEGFRYLTHGAFSMGDCHIVFIDFVAQCHEPYEVKLNSEFSEWGFFSASELEELPIVPSTKATALLAMRQASQQRLAETLSSYNLGLARKTISLQEHQTNWALAYEHVIAGLRENLSTDSDYQFEHVGSTSIPGLAAKPILDILVLFEDLESFKKDLSLFEQFGFTYKGDAIANINQSKIDHERHFLAFYNPEANIDYVHIHALPKLHPYAKRLCLFRDKLRKDPKLLQAYSKLKSELKLQGLVRATYTVSKDAFIAEVLKTSP